jgi:hypothetical protein
VGWKERKAVAADLKTIDRAATVELAEQALREFETKWGNRLPSLSKSWRTHWPELITFLKYPAEIRKAIYTTNALLPFVCLSSPSSIRLPAFVCDCLAPRWIAGEAGSSISPTSPASNHR